MVGNSRNPTRPENYVAIQTLDDHGSRRANMDFLGRAVQFFNL